MFCVVNYGWPHTIAVYNVPVYMPVFYTALISTVLLEYGTIVGMYIYTVAYTTMNSFYIPVSSLFQNLGSLCLYVCRWKTKIHTSLC